MNKKTLGIAIPYYETTAQRKNAFKELMDKLIVQLNDKMIMYIYEDGQEASWLKEYKNDNLIINSGNPNKGVSYARNQCLDYLIDKVNYILFIDSDDMVDDDYLKVMYEYCDDNSHEIIESAMYIKDVKVEYNPKLIKNGVAGSALKTSIIGNIRFQEDLQIGEDTKFMHDVIDLDKYRKKYARTFYYYRLGIDECSLTISYQNRKIGKKRS